MISKGHPEDKENARELRKSGAVLFFSTTSNMLFVREDSVWKALGHVVPVDAPMMNQPIHPRWKGNLPNGL